MNWAWASSLDHLWRSPTFPMWLTLAAAGFFGLIVLITLLRAERSVANGALTVITLLAIAVAAAATIRGFGTGSGAAGRIAPGETRSLQAMGPSLPALSCIDDLAGDQVLTACEKSLFGSAESTAAAVAYAASLVSRLNASGDVAAANKRMTPELQTLRRAVEHDRYGLMAYVLLTRDRCTTAECATFQALDDRRQIVANMDDRVYEGLIMRHSPSWNAPPPGPVAAMPSSMPSGKPTNADFPSAASTPPVNIMTPEPGPGASTPRPPAAAANASAPSARPATAAPPAKKPAAQKSARAPAAAPVQLSPAPGAPAAAND